MPIILTHRGLEPSGKDRFTESSLEAFLDHLERGFSLEMDLCFTKDGITFCHDPNLKRLTAGKDGRLLRELTTSEACSSILTNGRLGTFEEIMSALHKYPEQMIALHFKGIDQNQILCDLLVKKLKPFSNIMNRVLVFDLSINTATYLKLQIPQLNLAASVAHPYDIERFQKATNGTLLTLEQFISKKKLYSWAWLDEWDLSDMRADGTINTRGKELYTPAVFNALRKQGIKIALVTPELHATSPGLLGREAHPHASTRERLFKRITEILNLHPDAICTDYPEEVRKMLQENFNTEALKRLQAISAEPVELQRTPPSQ